MQVCIQDLLSWLALDSSQVAQVSRRFMLSNGIQGNGWLEPTMLKWMCHVNSKFPRTKLSKVTLSPKTSWRSAPGLEPCGLPPRLTSYHLHNPKHIIVEHLLNQISQFTISSFEPRLSSSTTEHPKGRIREVHFISGILIILWNRPRLKWSDPKSTAEFLSWAFVSYPFLGHFGKVISQTTYWLISP